MKSIVVEHVIGKLADLRPAPSSVDTVSLSAEQRERPHLRVRSEQGRELVISLPRGAELDEGDVLATDEGVVVAVSAALEDLIEVRPISARQWAMSSNQLGNLHRPVRFLAETMLTPYDHILDHVLHDMEVPFKRVERGFVGERVPAFSGGHGHGHGPGHHHHD